MSKRAQELLSKRAHSGAMLKLIRFKMLLTTTTNDTDRLRFA